MRKCGLPHTSLASKQNRGPSSHNRSRIATHRTAVPTPYLPYLVYQTFCCPAQSHPQLQLLEQQKESPSPHTCGIVCQLSSFRFSILRCARFCQHFYSFVVVPALFRFVRNRHLFAHACMQAADSEVTLAQEHDGLGADARLATRISSDLTRTFTIARLTRTIAHCFRVDPQLPT